MADYSTEKGFTIQSLATDPVASEVLGGTWASGGNLNLARQGLRGAGTQTAGIVAGGSGVPGKNDETETYNGTAWTEVADLNTARSDGGMASAGPSTANLYFCGQGTNPSPPPGNLALTSTETWNGTAWTEVAATGLTLGVANIGTGTQTAAVVAGGDAGGGTTGAGLWDGTSWAATGAMNTGRYYLAGCGTSTASIVFGKEPASAITETFNGSTWTAVNSLNNARNAAAGFGTTTSAIAAGNLEPPASVDQQTESWDGTSWAAVANLATGRWYAAGAGTGTSGLAAGGAIPAQTNVTEEWSVPSTVSVAQEGQVWYNTTSNVLKGFGMLGTGAWASGGILNSGRGSLASAGRTVATSLAIGGNFPPIGAVDYVEQYNGTSWTEIADINTARSFLEGTGTSTAALTTGGGPPVSAANESFNGTSWTTVNSLNTARGQGGEVGTSTAALYFAGAAPSTVYDICEKWDGTSWTEVADLNTARRYANAGGVTNTAALCMGGNTSNPGSTATANSETWDGTSWTEGNNITTARFNSGSGGPSTATIFFGGNIPPGSATTETYNGTSWTEVADLATARSDLAGTAAGTTSALAIGGGIAPIALQAAEEWTVPNAVKTFTAS